MHDVKIDGISVRDDWGLVLASAPEITPPEAKTNVLDIPGANGAIDLTAAVRGYPVFQERTGSLTFVSRDRFELWNARRSGIMAKLQGRQVTLRFEDDPGWYWTGALNVRQGETHEKGAAVTIDYRLYPYKRADSLSTEPWKWDPFSFIDGVIGNGTYVDTSVDPPITYQGAGLYSDVEIGTTAVDLDFLDSGGEPVGVAFTAADEAVTILYGTSGSVSVTAGTTKTVSGLTLCGTEWLYNGRPVTVQAQTASGTASLSLGFRMGRL